MEETAQKQPCEDMTLGQIFSTDIGHYWSYEMKS
jgi:hypothetical protein